MAFWAFFALALPVIAHMAYRQVTNRYLFPSLRFIKPARIPRTGRKTPTDWLLLFARVLLFAVLACLFADPYWKKITLPEETKVGRETIIALDLSPSMSGWAGLSEAKEKIDNLLGGIEGQVGYVGFDAGVLAEVPPSEEVGLVQNAVASATAGYGEGNPQTGIDRATKLFSPVAKERHLVIFSDFQRSDWQTTYRRLDEEGIAVELRPVGHSKKVGQKREGNLSLTEARAAPAGLGKVRAWAVVRNSSNEPVNTTISIEAGGEIREEKPIMVPANGATQAQFILPEGDFASAILKLMEEDELAADNVRHLWLKAPPPRRFGFWSSTNESEETSEEREFLKVAIESAGDNGWNRWLSVQENADGLRIGDLTSELDLLVVTGIGSWFADEKLGESMKAYLRSGGIAIMTPSEPFAASVSTLRDSGLLDLGFVRVVGGAGATRKPFRIAALEPSSHLAKTFSGKAARDLYLTGVYRYGLIRPAKDDRVTTPLRSTEGNPFVVQRTLPEGGKLTFFPYRLNVRWTDLPMRNSFLPLLMELIRGSKGAIDRSWPRLKSGETLVDGEKIFRAQEPGTFRFLDRFVEVALPPSESIAEVIESAETKESLGVSSNLGETEITGKDLDEEESKSLWLWFAIAAVILFIAENLWSRPRRTTEPEKDTVNA